MADLTRADVQHAVQEAMHHVSNEVAHIAHVVDGMNRVSQDVRNLTARLGNLEQSVHQVQNVLASTSGRSSTGGLESQVAQLMQEMNDLRTRFTVVEQFSKQMSDYVQSQIDRDREDRQYRTG